MPLLTTQTRHWENSRNVQEPFRWFQWFSLFSQCIYLLCPVKKERGQFKIILLDLRTKSVRAFRGLERNWKMTREIQEQRLLGRRVKHTPSGRRWRSSPPHGPCSWLRWRPRQHCPAPAAPPSSFHWLRLWSGWWQGFSLKRPLRRSCYRSLACRSLKQSKFEERIWTRLSVSQSDPFGELQRDVVSWTMKVRRETGKTAQIAIKERSVQLSILNEWTFLERSSFLCKALSMPLLPRHPILKTADYSVFTAC